MTDIDMTRLAAEAMGIPEWAISFQEGGEMFNELYDPLHNDAQAMQLVKKLQFALRPPEESDEWVVTGDTDYSCDIDLNRAIVECCAKMQAARKAAV